VITDGCLECGTCRVVCSEHRNVLWEYPRGGYGILFNSADQNFLTGMECLRSAVADLARRQPEDARGLAWTQPAVSMASTRRRARLPAHQWMAVPRGVADSGGSGAAGGGGSCRRMRRDDGQRNDALGRVRGPSPQDGR